MRKIIYLIRNWYRQSFFSRYPYLIHIILFIVTFFTCTIAGTLWAYKDITNPSNWHFGLTYAVLILTFLSSHEFGHYFASRIHKVDATLPYYIPFPFPIAPNFGTFGAVIKTRTPIPTNKALFDIGVAGPISGFVVCLIILIYGLHTLPTIDYIYSIHPEYIIKYGGRIPENNLFFGDTLLYTFISKLFANPHGFLPPMNEIYHYPFLCVGWFGLFVTSLNMIPIGQLDGGHVTYAMFGKKNHGRIAKFSWWFIIIIGFGSVLGIAVDYLTEYLKDPLIFPLLMRLKHIIPWYFRGWEGWIFWAFITRVVIKMHHPPIMYEEELDPTRKLIGWLALAILILCFSYNGIYIIE